MKGRQATLARIHRVRTVQLGLARGVEAQAAEALASEHALTRRIADLAAAVAPAAEATGAVALAARAVYRDQLHRSAAAAVTRVEAAERRAALAAEVTRAARRDEMAADKLIARARAAALTREMLDLQNTKPPARRKRHDPC